MTRNSAIDALAKTTEGKIPWKYVPDLMAYLSITKERFLANLDRFTNRKIFKIGTGGRLMKDADGDVVRLFYPEKS
jgi:hypothetical protein